MNIEFTEAFQNAFVLSVYPERITLMQKLFAYERLSMPKLFNGVMKKGIYAAPCCHGYALIIQHAINNNLPFIWIFDDDAYPCKNSRQLMENKYLNDIPDDVQFLQFGWSKNDNSYDNKFNRITKDCKCSCSYILFRNAYKKSLDLLQGKYGAYYAHGDTMSLKLISYVIDNPIFIQYNLNNSKSYNNNIGYDTRHDRRLSNKEYFTNRFNLIENILLQ